jgi:CBS domain-containing protein
MDTILIKQIMTETLTVANLSHSFSQVMEFFNRYNIHHLPVTDEQKIIGIISVSDVMKTIHLKLQAGESISLEQLNKDVTVKDMMTHSLVTVHPETDIEEAMAILANNDFHALPVVENGVLKGIVTEYDILKANYVERKPPHYSISAPGFGV